MATQTQDKTDSPAEVVVNLDDVLAPYLTDTKADDGKTTVPGLQSLFGGLAKAEKAEAETAETLAKRREEVLIWRMQIGRRVVAARSALMGAGMTGKAADEMIEPHCEGRAFKTVYGWNTAATIADEIGDEDVVRAIGSTDSLNRLSQIPSKASRRSVAKAVVKAGRPTYSTVNKAVKAKVAGSVEGSAKAEARKTARHGRIIGRFGPYVNALIVDDEGVIREAFTLADLETYGRLVVAALTGVKVDEDDSSEDVLGRLAPETVEILDGLTYFQPESETADREAAATVGA